MCCSRTQNPYTLANNMLWLHR